MRRRVLSRCSVPQSVVRAKVFDGEARVCRLSPDMNSIARSLHRILFVSAVILSGAMMTSPVLADVAEPQLDQGYLVLGFDQLASYTFTPPPFNPDADPKATPAGGEEQIPAKVKAWDGKKAMVTGFMLPVKLDNGLVTEFLLVKDAMMCCYGSVPNMNEWVVVKMAKGVRPLMDVPISFYGQLKVGAMFENGYMTGIYSLDGERMGEVKS
jgi:hypothetical protein